MLLLTDVMAMGGPFARAATAWLLGEAARLEAAEAALPDKFSTSLSDSERQYLDVTAELYARGALPLLGVPCDGNLR